MNIPIYTSITASGFFESEEIGRGSERAVYISKQCENKVLKLSLFPYKNKQILREIKFYKHLIEHKMPMTHLPQLMRLPTINQDLVNGALDKFLNYLLTYNIVINDLQPHNLRIKVFETAYKVYLIDGFGSRLGIPIDYVFTRLGRKHIVHQWEKFKMFMLSNFNSDML